MNIFYTEVDKNLQLELNARGKTGFQSRTTKAIDFMVGKIANVEITAYQGSSSISGVAKNRQAILGGAQIQTGRYLPSGKEGYLSDEYFVKESIDFINEKNINTSQVQSTNNPLIGNAYLKETPIQDTSRRTGPYITALDVTIGDHSMGLLNKATVNFVIPNVARDLDDIEEVWFRPGRYVSIDIVHPESALVSRADTGGYLTEQTLPNKDRIKELYPGWDVDKFLKEISKMNEFRFEGLITSFNFSYTADGTVEATISLTGTSNVYTDVSMYLPGNQKNDKKTAPGTNTENFKIQPIIKTIPSIVGEGSQTTKLELYDVIYERMDALKRKFQDYSDATKKFTQFLLPFTLDQNYVNATDHFFLIGQQWLPKIESSQIPEAKNEFKYTGPIKSKIIQLTKYDDYKNDLTLRTKRATELGITPEELFNRLQANTGTLTADASVNDLLIFKTIVLQLNSNNLISAREFSSFGADINRAEKAKEAEEKRVSQANAKRSDFINNFNDKLVQANENRYITLGALIHVINKYIIANKNTTEVAEIIHSDSACFSNYYPSLVSTDPDQVLFLPKDPAVLFDMNCYGSHEGIISGTFPDPLIYYSDIIKQISQYGLTPDALFESGWKEWPGVYEKGEVTGKMYPSRIFINMEVIQKIIDDLSKQKNGYTIKLFIAKISAVVSRCSGNAIDLKLVSYPKDQTKLLLADTRYLKSGNEIVNPYSIPMFANHPNGSIVREFSFSAKLPESVKNLSYVLNQGDDVTEEQIAPYMNFMYNAKDPDAINNLITLYKTKFTEKVASLNLAKANYGLSPGVTERKQALYKAVIDYIKYPTSDIRTSQQLTAPIFPFEVEFTIDGINGLRYGDVLTFEALPSKYRINTVFSVIGITHTISTEGDWTTKVNCIMRPSIG
jgi:hypothetical protein